MNDCNTIGPVKDEIVVLATNFNGASRFSRPLWVLLCVVSTMATARPDEDAAPPVSLGLQVEAKSDAETRFQSAGIPSLAARKCVVISAVDPNGPCAGVLNVNTAITSLSGIPTPDLEAYEAAAKAIKADAVVEIKGLYLAPSPQGKQRWQSGSTKIRLDNAVGQQNAMVVGEKRSQEPPVTIVSKNLPDPTNQHLLEAEEVPSVITLPDRIRALIQLPANNNADKWDGLLPDSDLRSIACEMSDSRAGDRSYICQKTGEDGVVTIWNAKTGNRLRVAEGKVAKIYAPLAFSSNEQYLASLDGSYVRVWRIEEGNTLSLYGSTTVTGMDGSIDEEFSVTWADDSHLILCSTNLGGEVRLFTVKDGGIASSGTLGRVNQWATSDTEARAMTWGNAGKAVALIRNEDTKYTRYFLRAFTLLDTKITGQVPFTAGLVKSLPLDFCLFRQREQLCEMRITQDNKRVLIGMVTEDSPSGDEQGRQVVICDAVTLKPQGMFSLSANDIIAAVSRDENCAVVLRATTAKSKTVEEVAYAALVYDLKTGRRLAAFSLGDEFTATRVREAGRPMQAPKIHFTDDAQHVLALGCVPTNASSDGGGDSASGKVALVIGKWRVEDGVRERLLTRQQSYRGIPHYVYIPEMFDLWLWQDGLSVCAAPDAAKPDAQDARATNVLRVEDLLRTADLIREGDQLLGSNDLKAAVERYKEAIASGNDWWFKDQYPHLLNACFDYKAVTGDEAAAKEIAIWLKEQKVSISPTSKEGGRVLASLKAEEEARAEAARKESEVASKMRRDELAKQRKENQERFVPSQRLTKNEFIQKLDDVKSNGVIGIGGVTNVQFVNHSFQDAIGDPTKTITLDVGKVEMGFECRDGWVWLRVTAVPAQGITVVTSMDLR